MRDRLPTFLVIGAQKCGTSWLYHMLRQHPEVAVGRPKEVHYFNKAYNYSRGLEWYARHFDLLPATRAVGDFTPNYLWTSDDPDEIAESQRTGDVPGLAHQALPGAKLIVSLRDPVKRAMSAYYHLIRDGYVSPRQTILDVADHYGIVTMGYYDLHLRRWMHHFPREQFLILLYEEDLAPGRRLQTLQRVCRHIGVDDSFVPQDLHGQFNVRDSHFNMRIARLPRLLRGGLRRLLPERVKDAALWHIPVRDAEIQALRSLFQPHTSRLSEMLGRELPWE